MKKMENTYDKTLIEIDSAEDFHEILEEMYCIEDCFEGMHSWVGKMISGEKNKDILTVLADDSDDHKKRLSKLISRIEGIELESKDVDRFDFKEGMDDEKILKKVLENDYAALYHYTLLRTQVDEGFLSDMLSEEDIEYYYETMDHLIEEELKHIKMLRSELDLE